VIEVNERILALKAAVGKNRLSAVSVYNPQVGRPIKEKVGFYAQLRNVLSNVTSGEKLILCRDLNGQLDL